MKIWKRDMDFLLFRFLFHAAYGRRFAAVRDKDKIPDPDGIRNGIFISF